MNDNELRQALTILDAYERQLVALSDQTGILQMSFEESLRSRDTLKALIDAKEGDELLVPIGGGVHLYLTVPKKKAAVVGVGSTISVEKELDEALETVTSRIEELREALKNIDANMKETSDAAEKLSISVQQEYQRRQQ